MSIIGVPNLKEIECYFSETKLNIFVICVKKKVKKIGQFSGMNISKMLNYFPSIMIWEVVYM